MLELAETLFHFEQGLYGPATGLTVVTPDGFEHRAALGARVEALKTGTAEITADDFAITEALIAALGGYSPEFRSGFDALLSGNHAIETNCFTQSLLCIGALVTFLGSSLSVLGACSLTGPLTLACVAAVLAATGLSITSVAACAIWVDDCGGPEEEVQCPDTTPPPCHSPIIIDLDRNNFQLTGVADPVFFDIDADGTKDELCWTDGTQLDGFLALDRDGNDTIDDGGELFGNHTLLISGEKAPNGYVALAEFDQLSEGGNEDEVIDHLDAIFPKLRIWIDANHDGVSQPSELTSLAEAGVKRLDVTYTESQRLDAHGNALRYLSKAWVEGAGNSEKPVKTSDVFFVLAE